MAVAPIRKGYYFERTGSPHTVVFKVRATTINRMRISCLLTHALNATTLWRVCVCVRARVVGGHRRREGAVVPLYGSSPRLEAPASPASAAWRPISSSSPASRTYTFTYARCHHARTHARTHANALVAESNARS
jgi:hypothetical protein